jgi:hypothetical protein
MMHETLAILTAAVTALSTLTAVWLTNRAVTRREQSSFERSIGRETREQLTSLFTRALIVLDRHARNVGMASESDLSDMLDVKARLELQANADVALQFENTARALDSWAIEVRQGSPRPGPGGTTIFSTGKGEEKHNEHAAELWPVFGEERTKLMAAMRSSLGSR